MLIDYIAPFAVVLASVLGFVFGRRKVNAEVESLSVAASKVAVESLIATVQPLRDEIHDLKVQVRELKRQNAALIEENRALQQNVSDLRRTLQRLDNWPPFEGGGFAADPNVRE